MEVIIARQLLVRDVPEDVKDWVEKERLRRMVSQKEFLLSILQEAKDDQRQLPLFDNERHKPNVKNNTIPFTFVDLFAGIGGFRIGLERLGGRCIFSSEWDKYAQKTYHAWFGDIPKGDIRKIDPREIPDHDIMTAGFPCQPFSIAGVSKKISLGREHGFKDKTQGTLFFYLATIAQIKRPPVLILENVKNLLSHDKRRTWEVIRSTLEDLDYVVFHKVIDAAAYVPQHRERVFIICFDRKVFGDEIPFEFPPEPVCKPPKLGSILVSSPPDKYILSDHLWSYLQNYAKEHKAKGNGFGYGLADKNGRSRTLSARYYKDGSEILIPRGKDKNPRRLTPQEAARLMGFGDFASHIVVSDTQAYRQFGNAIVPAVVEDVGRKVLETLCWHVLRVGNGCLVKRN